MWTLIWVTGWSNIKTKIYLIENIFKTIRECESDGDNVDESVKSDIDTNNLESKSSEPKSK